MYIKIVCPYCESAMAAKVDVNKLRTVNMCCPGCYTTFLATPISVQAPTKIQKPVLFSFCCMGGPPCSILQEA